MSDAFVRPKATKVGGVKIPHVIPESAPQSVRIDDTGIYQYFGFADIGASETDPVWKISRLSATNPQALLWADGNANADNVWESRSFITYS